MNYSDIGKKYSDGEVIFREGEEGENMFVIQSGKVRITKRTEREDLHIATLGEGEIFGEMALFDKLPRSANASAEGEARVLCIDKKKFFSSASRDPSLVFKLLETISMRLRRLDEEFAKLKKSRHEILKAFMDVDETCRLILDEARNIITADNGSIMLFDRARDSLIIKSAFGENPPEKMEFSRGEGIAGDVLKTGKAELVNNVSIDSRFLTGEAEIYSMLCVPLKSPKSVFGVINLSNGSEKMFTVENLRILHTLAVYASIAILNAVSFSRLNSATEDVLVHASIFDI
ncbi:MAG: cyclic nucleotide-binding domain-containing protein [Nitrospirae bacterium]|nr:cyclic nucleotide-binding domain-containing protein [Nitrospirota bacterium]